MVPVPLEDGVGGGQVQSMRSEKSARARSLWTTSCVPEEWRSQRNRETQSHLQGFLEDRTQCEGCQGRETESLLVEVGVKSLGPEISCFFSASGYCGT